MIYTSSCLTHEPYPYGIKLLNSRSECFPILSYLTYISQVHFSKYINHIRSLTTNSFLYSQYTEPDSLANIFLLTQYILFMNTFHFTKWTTDYFTCDISDLSYHFENSLLISRYFSLNLHYYLKHSSQRFLLLNPHSMTTN
jgi:hypothetical protein